MHKLWLSGLFFLCALSSPFATASSAYGVHEDHPYEYSIKKDVYKLYEIYQINSPRKDTYAGSIKKSPFRLRRTYDLSNQAGWQATGVIPIISSGSLYNWAKDIDIYDTRGVKIGFIDGNLATFEAAKFDFYEYDAAGNALKIGTAYSNAQFDRFVVFGTANDPRPIAEINRHLSEKTWTVTVHYPEMIDDRIIRIFSAFAVDYEDQFLKPTSCVNCTIL